MFKKFTKQITAKLFEVRVFLLMSSQFKFCAETHFVANKFSACFDEVNVA